MSEGEEILPVLYWPYPDSLEKMVMNHLTLNNFLSKKAFMNEEVAVYMENVLDMFEGAGYVTSSMAVHPSDGLSYKMWTVTPFFQSRIQAQKDLIAEEDEIKMALWNQRGELLNMHKRKLARSVETVAPVDQLESTMMDKIQPDLQKFEKKMRDDMEEKKRLKRIMQEQEESNNAE